MIRAFVLGGALLCLAAACESTVEKHVPPVPPVPFRRGECDQDADCGGDFRCVEIVPGGYRVCETKPEYELPTECGGPYDECCDDGECPDGRCLHLVQNANLCSDYGEDAHNACVDECDDDADCAETYAIPKRVQGICSPPGVYGWLGRRCFAAYCRVDADCLEELGGVCAVIESGCGGTCVPVVGCVYPGPTACATWADCGEDDMCIFRPSEGRAHCVDFDPEEGLCGG